MTRTMTIINMTPHVINVIGDSCHHGRVTDDDGMDEFCTCCKDFKPSGTVARVATTEEIVDTINGITITKTTYGEVEGLPEETKGVYLIVSRLVLNACPKRADLLCPGTLVRNDKGQPIGCKGLSR